MGGPGLNYFTVTDISSYGNPTFSAFTEVTAKVYTVDVQPGQQGPLGVWLVEGAAQDFTTVFNKPSNTLEFDYDTIAPEVTLKVTASLFGEGADGELSVLAGETVTLDTDAHAQFEYTSVTIAAGGVVWANGSAPLVILATGSVTIAGVLD
eukprot:9200392-Pyramimonas_sp.AAC.1